MRIGVDLGGTKIEVAALGDDGEILLRRRVPSPSHAYVRSSRPSSSWFSVPRRNWVDKAPSGLPTQGPSHRPPDSSRIRTPRS